MIVHYPGPDRPGSTACGLGPPAGLLGWRISADGDAVTCERCKGTAVYRVIAAAMQAGEREPLTTAAAGRAYEAVFTAVRDGENRTAALVLRELGADQLAELIVICGYVRTMAEAEQRRRAGEAGSA